MPYRITESDKSIQGALRRIADEQIGRAIDKARDRTRDPGETVHQVRKHCKKLRGLIRLVRPVFAAYGSENGAFRDAARGLSSVRDIDVAVGTLDRLMMAHRSHVAADAFAPVRAGLAQQADARAAPDEVWARLAVFADTMSAARERAPHWTLRVEGFKAVREGVVKTYGRAIVAMEKAADAPSDEAFHEWRKRAKYHWHHTRLLAEIWPDAMRMRRDAAKALADRLGEHHDLQVLAERLRAHPDLFGPSVTVDTLLDLIAKRQETLNAEAFIDGRRLLAEKPKALAQRWRQYWRTWR